MREHRQRIRANVGWFGLVLLWLTCAAAPAQAVPTLRNNVIPGTQVAYSVQIDLTRTSEHDGLSTVIEASQHAQLTVINLNLLGEGRVQRAWILELDEPAVKSAKVGDQPLDVPPRPVQLGMPPRSVRFLSDSAEMLATSMVEPGGHWLYEAAFLISLDLGHWPDRELTARDTWGTPIAWEDFGGQRACRMLRLNAAGPERSAVMDEEVTGEFKGRYQTQASLRSARVELEWSLTESCLLRGDSSVMFGLTEGTVSHEVLIHTSTERNSKARLDPAACTSSAEQLAKLLPAIEAFNDRQPDTALDMLDRFAAASPDSLWTPVVADMRSRLIFERDVLGFQPQQEVLARLAKLIEAWQAADLAGDDEKLDGIREGISALVHEHGDEVVKHTRDADPSIRAVALFCLAFSEDVEAVKTLRAALNDEHPRVRAWAVYGFGQRAGESVEFDAFIQALADPVELVRQRACQAVRLRVDRTTLGRERLVPVLMNLMADDANADVRLFATRALRRFATARELPRMLDIEDHETEPTIRSEMRDLVIQLGGVPKSANRK